MLTPFGYSSEPGFGPLVSLRVPFFSAGRSTEAAALALKISGLAKGQSSPEIVGIRAERDSPKGYRRMRVLSANLHQGCWSAGICMHEKRVQDVVGCAWLERSLWGTAFAVNFHPDMVVWISACLDIFLSHSRSLSLSFSSLSLCIFRNGCGSKNRYHNGTLASGNMGTKTCGMNPCCLILSRTQLGYRLAPGFLGPKLRTEGSGESGPSDKP